MNAHPGYIPLARGLDALKWAVLEGLPVGATTHFLGNEVDAGEVIERRELEIRSAESFFELGMRVYRTEVDMLVRALEKLDEPHEFIASGGTISIAGCRGTSNSKCSANNESIVSEVEGR